MAKNVNAKYPFNKDGDTRLREALDAKTLGFAKWGSGFGQNRLGVSEASPDGPSNLAQLEVGATKEDYFGGSAAFASKLAGVDGAIVLTTDLAIRAFGAELVNLPELPASIAVTHGDGATSDADPLSFGTRHRSAFRFVLAVPDSHVVVVSQDGSAKLVTNNGGKVKVVTND